MCTLISSATILINTQTLLLTFSHSSIREIVISLFKKNLYYRYAVYKNMSSYLPNVVNVDFQRRDIRGALCNLSIAHCSHTRLLINSTYSDSLCKLS